MAPYKLIFDGCGATLRWSKYLLYTFRYYLCGLAFWPTCALTVQSIWVPFASCYSCDRELYPHWVAPDITYLHTFQVMLGACVLFWPVIAVMYVGLLLHLPLLFLRMGKRIRYQAFIEFSLGPTFVIPIVTLFVFLS